MVKSGLDLNLARSIRGISNPIARTANEHGQTCICASDVALAADHFPQMCRSLQRRAQGQSLHLSRSVSLYGVRATDLSRESARHRSLSAQSVRQALPHGLSQYGVAQYVGQCECGSRLAHLCRLRTKPDWNSTPALRGRTVWRRSLGDGLRTGCNHHRSVSVGISVGSVSFDQSGDQAAYAARPAWQYPQLHPHQRRQAARREYSRPDHSRSWGVLHHGSRLSRLRQAASFAPSRRFLRDACQGESALYATILPANRSLDWHHLRPIGYADRFLFSAAFPNDDQAHQNQRCGGQDVGLLDQPSRPVGTKHCRSLSLPLANRVVFQMDQAASAYQVLLRYFRERGQISNLDRRLGLRSGCHPAKATEDHRLALRNATNPEPHYVRENGFKSTVGAYATGNKFTRFNQPVVSVRLTLGR